MASSETFTGLASEADCLFLCQNISGIGESESELRQHSDSTRLVFCWVVVHLKWGGDSDTFLMLYRAIVRSKFDYGCIVYGTASNTNLRQLDNIHNSGLRLALGAFCTS